MEAKIKLNQAETKRLVSNGVAGALAPPQEKPQQFRPNAPVGGMPRASGRGSIMKRGARRPVWKWSDAGK